MVRRSVRHLMTVSSSLGRRACKSAFLRLPSRGLFFDCSQRDRKVSATLLHGRGRLTIARAPNGPLRTGGASKLALAGRPQSSTAGGDRRQTLHCSQGGSSGCFRLGAVARVAEAAGS